MLKYHPDGSTWRILNLAHNAPHLLAYIEMFRELPIVKPYCLDPEIARTYWTRAVKKNKKFCELSHLDYSAKSL
jgi:hypothetical protein